MSEGKQEKQLIKEFNDFIKEWCGSYYAHLVDSDENDGEFLREKIRHLCKSHDKLVEACKEIVNYMDDEIMGRSMPADTFIRLKIKVEDALALAGKGGRS